MSSKLRSILRKIDGRGYKAYKQIEGRYHFPDYQLIIDHAQADPFAPPSAVRVKVPQEKARFPSELSETKPKKTALEDYLTRRFYQTTRTFSKRCGTGNSGLVTILKPSQQVLERSSMEISGDGVEARFWIGLPARGRRILGREAMHIFDNVLPKIVENSLIYRNLEPEKVKTHVEVVEDAEYIRQHLRKSGLVAFVANGAVLPRRSGVDERPLQNAVRFQSPPSLEVCFECPNRAIKGMGIPEGVTLIVGGGYHGKTTLLNALALGVYNHIPGDGREFVVTVSDAVKIRAEDGRYVANVDISSFISNLPDGRDTAHFSTENASGSTSQAANIVEALEMGCRLLLIDEDTSATNLMIRDRRMQELVTKDKEPITPLIDLIPSLKRKGVSIVMVMGGLGEYFDVADTVIMMDAYRPQDVTDRAREIARKHGIRPKATPQEIKIRDRVPDLKSIDPEWRGKVRIKARGISGITFGKRTIDLGRVEQLVETAQLTAIGELIYLISKSRRSRCLREMLDEVEEKMEREGLTSLLPPRGCYAKPRKFEIAAAMNRLRGSLWR